MPTARKLPLTVAQRDIIAGMLAEGKGRRAIAERLNRHESTIRGWLREDPSLEEAAEELRQTVYEKCLERLEANALAPVTTSSAEQHKAMMEIINRHEAAMRRKDGEITKDGAQLLLMQVCAILVDMPEAKMKVINAYTNAGNQADDAEAGPGLLSSDEAGEKPTEA